MTTEDTLPRTNGTPTLIDARSVVDELPLTSLTFEERYRTRAQLGRGGMGEVVATQDAQIGREIALKRMRVDRRTAASTRARFLREARVQAQLEHPAIVPVYDLGTDEEGDTWFTMKLVRGATLAEIIAGLRAEAPDVVAKYTRRRLLTAFSSVCLAIDFAHTRGVIHRDLKPENIMLGDFGEVYVLDWGIAKIAGVSDAELARVDSGRASTELDLPGTSLGEVIGTIGYMPPEQLRGETDAIGPRTDVWALGAILFELLAREPLLPRTSLAEAIADVDREIETRPSSRSREPLSSPDLDAICARALARLPADRYASARELHDDLERVLDGDRELQVRREQAAVHLERAREAERRADIDGPEGLAARTVAMQEINRALALDPSSEPAQRAMVRLLVEPPRAVPERARAELAAITGDQTRFGFGVAALGFLSMYMFLPLYAWMGIRDWGVTGACCALIAVSAAVLFWGSRRPRHARTAVMISTVTAGILIALLTRVVGPVASAPVLAFGMAVGVVFNPVGLGFRGVLALLGIALIAPTALELLGVLDASYQFHDGHLWVVPHMTDLPRIPTIVTLTMTSICTIAIVGVYLSRLKQMLSSAQERLWLYSWNVRQFLPVRSDH